MGFLDLDFEIFLGLTAWVGSWGFSTSIAALKVEENLKIGISSRNRRYLH